MIRLCMGIRHNIHTHIAFWGHSVYFQGHRSASKFICTPLNVPLLTIHRRYHERSSLNLQTTESTQERNSEVPYQNLTVSIPECTSKISSEIILASQYQFYINLLSLHITVLYPIKQMPIYGISKRLTNLQYQYCL